MTKDGVLGKNKEGWETTYCIYESRWQKIESGELKLIKLKLELTKSECTKTLTFCLEKKTF